MIRKNEGVQQKIGKLNRKPGRLVDEVYLCDFRGKKKRRESPVEVHIGTRVLDQLGVYDRVNALL